MKMRRHPEQRSALLATFGLRLRLAVEEIAVDHAETMDLADATGLTAYDASYLWLALKLDAELESLDRGWRGRRRFENWTKGRRPVS